MTPEPGGLSRLHRWGELMARHRAVVLIGWLLLLGAAAAAYPHLESQLGMPDYTVAGSESAQAQALVDRDFPQLGAEQDVVAFQSDRYRTDDPAYRRLVDQVLDVVRGGAQVASVGSPYDAAGAGQISADQHVALAIVGLRGDQSERAASSADLQARIQHVAGVGPVAVWLTGPSPLTDDLSSVELHDQEVAESIGIPIALVVLLLCFGAGVAAALPVVFAVSAVLSCTGVLSLLVMQMHFDRFVTVIMTVIGIGIGIDYALFIVSRFREELADRAVGGSAGPPDRAAVREAVGVALHTSGRTVLTSGLIVVLALSSMLVISGHLFMEIAVAAALVVACCVIAALTLLPALLAMLGHRIDAWPLPRRRRATTKAGRPRRNASWVRIVLRHPIRLALPALVLLGLLAWPATSIRLGLDLGLASLGGTPSGRGEQVVATNFGPGMVGPIEVTATAAGQLDTSQLDGIARLTAALRADRRVARVTSVTDVLDQQVGDHSATGLRRAAAMPTLQPVLGELIDLAQGGQCAYLSVIPAVPIDSPDASALVSDIRGTLAPHALAGTGVQVDVGGLTAEWVDFSAETVGRLPLVIGIVLALSLCYLLVIYRSLFVPAKAIVLNILATAASLGLTVLVFQDGHGATMLGFTSVGTLQAYLPVALFSLLFGLSMDYEVFLVSRIQEEWLRSGDNTSAIAVAFDHTARQIMAGAAIMLVVFGSLLTAQVLELKQFGFGLAAAVFLDATVVRMLLVPATMSLAGGANWWLPPPLARLLPAWRPE